MSRAIVVLILVQKLKRILLLTLILTKLCNTTRKLITLIFTVAIYQALDREPTRPKHESIYLRTTSSTLRVYSRSPKVGNPTASILKSNV